MASGLGAPPPTPPPTTRDPTPDAECVECANPHCHNSPHKLPERLPLLNSAGEPVAGKFLCAICAHKMRDAPWPVIWNPWRVGGRSGDPRGGSLYRRLSWWTGDAPTGQFFHHVINGPPTPPGGYALMCRCEDCESVVPAPGYRYPTRI